MKKALDRPRVALLNQPSITQKLEDFQGNIVNANTRVILGYFQPFQGKIIVM